MTAQWQNHRNLHERILVTGDLVLETPTSLGNGDSDSLIDMPLHLDPLKGEALLTGTSLAGGLRNYIHRYSPALAARLFGFVDRQTTKESQLIIDDALGGQPLVELRDGVAIDSKSRTALGRHKFDVELLQAGTRFPLSFELLLRRNDDRPTLLQAFALALSGLEKGEIPLGKRKRRGYGRCCAQNWRVQRYDMMHKEGMLAWLRGKQEAPDVSSPQTSIAALLGVDELVLPRPALTLTADFALDSSLLIRSAPPMASSADTVHLHSNRIVDGIPTPQSVLSGTSLAGALRARALRIANTLGMDGYLFVDELFGYRSKGEGDSTALTASRLWVEESIICDPLPLVQTRVTIDRFTGGSYPGALFSEEAAWGTGQTRVCVRLTLEKGDDPLREEAEIGMLLLLLKDLWTGDLPLGGESSVGRGRLYGRSACISIGNQTWTIQAQPGGALSLPEDAGPTLEHYVQKLGEWRHAHAA